MRRRDYLILASLGLTIALLGSRAIASPGYMDAEYYFATARELARGGGLSEPFLWNFLDDPSGIPHPSHLYWMPGVSLMAAAAMSVLGESFRAAQIPSILLTGILPVLTAWLSERLHPSRKRSMLAGLLGAFPGFFLPFMLTTDAFALYAWLGALGLFASANAIGSSKGRPWLLAGALAGLCHWVRADGGLVLVVAVVAALSAPPARLRSAALTVAGYLIVMLPWMGRNWIEIGTPFASGLARSMWFTDYDDLFIFPASRLTASRWWDTGLGPLLRVRVDALISNLKTLVVVDGLVFLTPLALWGAWLKRRQSVVLVHAIYLGLLLVVMSFIFPFAGPRGGFFHSSVALMPCIWMLSALGVEAFVEAGVRRRGWEAHRAERLFGSAAVGLAALVTAYAFYQRALAPTADGLAWQGSEARHQAIVESFPAIQTAEARVAANDPPGLYLAADVPVVPIPDGGLDMLKDMVERYHVRWVVLEFDHPQELAWLYANPASGPELRWVGEATSPRGQPVYLFEVESNGGGE